MTIGKRISDLRKASGYSQEYVAEKLGVSRQAVSKWETDAAAPDTYNLIALAELFSVSVEYIAIGKKENSEEKCAQVTAQKVNGSQRIAGFILLGAGLLSLILGVILSWLLVLLSVYLILGGVLCLVVRKRVWFALAWSYLIITLLWTPVLTGINILRVFFLASYKGGGTVNSWLSVLLLLWLAAMIAVSVVMFIKKKKRK